MNALATRLSAAGQGGLVGAHWYPVNTYQRQAARERGDWHGEHEAERELRRLWQRHAELEAAERAA